LAVDDDIVCTITNTLQNGHLIVQKTTIPGGDQTEFTINATGDGTITGGGAGTITDENDHDYEVTAGTYSVTETVPDGWSETANNCTDVVVAAGETEYCQIENTKLSSISGYKFEDIDGVLGTSEDRNALEGWLIELYVWEAEGWLDTGQSDTTDSSGYYEFSNLLPGLYQVLETLQVGWTNVSSLSQDVDLEAGENSEENDFINTEYVSITVHKDWDYDGDGEAEIFDKTDWTWDISGEDQDVATGSTIDDLLPGSYTISEDQKPTWHVIDLSCSVNGGDLVSYGVNESQEFVLGSGDNLDCTFVNARDRGNITGYKYNDLDGDGIVPEDGELGLEGWTIQAGVDESVEGSDITDANGYFEIANLITGLYTVCEVQQDDWNQTYPANDACHDVNLTTEGASVNFGNQGQGTITVHKNVDENGDGDLDDSEDVLGATNWLFELNTNDYAMGTTVPVAAGTYALSEFDQTGYHFVSLFCDDQQIDGDTADLVVGAGDDVVCTYTNARDTGTITVVKNIDWDESGQIGDHDNDVLGSTSWTWDIASGEQDIATGDSRSMVTDTYTINEDLQANYHLVGWTCDNDTSGDTNSIEVDLGSDDDITCTLTNAPDTGSIQGRKYHDLNGNGDFDQDEKTDANRLDDWTITLYDTDWNVVDSMETGDDGTVAGDVGVGQYLFVDVVPGNYYLCETPQDGWTQTEPSSGIQHTNETYCHEITIDPGEDINTIQFGNERDTGSILITKLIDADGDLQTTEDQFPGENWEMSVNGVSEDTSSPGSQNTDTNGETTFTPLNTGEYDVSETLQDGYDLLDAYCDEENGSLDDETLYGVEVGKDETVSCTFINTPNGTIHGYKWHDTDGDGVQNEFTGYLSGWTINLYQQNGENYDLINSMITDDTTHFGWYWFEHLFPGNYRVCEEPQTGWVQTYPNTESQCHDLTLPDDNSSGFPEQINAVGGPTYNFGNQEQSTVIVTKYLDENGNGDQDENEPNLPDWEIFLSQLSQLTDENGQATFQYITPGEYVLSETIQEGYEQTEISCADGGQTQIDPPSLDDLQVLQTNNELFLEVEPGDELECRIGNHPITPILTLTKSNDALTDQSPGDDVTFTLAITATQSAAYDVVIKDLPAGGFSYQGGTWTAASDIHGPLAIPEPVYASPGQWQLGDMEQDETITLTYLANINNSQEPGLYQDLAWAQGEDVIGGQTLANLSDDPLYFVGTEVNVVSEEQDPVDVSPQGEVLGASTELPATGAQAIWILIGSILILAGLSGITLALKLKRNYVS
jgi:protocatechuate 3,4-dioxygenase beta subunit